MCELNTDTYVPDNKPTSESLAELYANEPADLPEDAVPITYKTLFRHQQMDADLKRLASRSAGYTIKPFHGAGKTRHLICVNDKIVVPKTLQKRLVEWYHTQLCHPGETRTELTITQHFTWNNLRKTVKEVCSKCHTCQLTKRSDAKYGKLPAKIAETTPWETLCVDLIGPYSFSQPDGKTINLWAVTMIDPATNWFEIKEIDEKRADLIANAVELVWLTRYPWPNKITLDRGKEFMAEFSTMIVEDYGIKKKPITARNPQANSIIERIHQTIGNMLRTFEVQKETLDPVNPWSGILAAIMFATRATVHTTLAKTPSQLVFGRDAMLNILHKADWSLIKQRKQRLINLNNKRENAKRKTHTFQVGDKVLLANDRITKYRKAAYAGPFPVIAVHNNGTVTIKMNNIIDKFNIRLLKPYRE